MSEKDLLLVCELEDLPAGEARSFLVDGFALVLVNTGDAVYALEDSCPHQGAQLSEGEVVDTHICCHEHGWVVDLLSGAVQERDWVQVASFPAEVKNGKVFVQLD